MNQILFKRQELRVSDLCAPESDHILSIGVPPLSMMSLGNVSQSLKNSHHLHKLIPSQVHCFLINCPTCSCDLFVGNQHLNECQGFSFMLPLRHFPDFCNTLVHYWTRLDSGNCFFVILELCCCHQLDLKTPGLVGWNPYLYHYHHFLTQISCMLSFISIIVSMLMFVWCKQALHC